MTIDITPRELAVIMVVLRKHAISARSAARGAPTEHRAFYEREASICEEVSNRLERDELLNLAR